MDTMTLGEAMAAGDAWSLYSHRLTDAKKLQYLPTLERATKVLVDHAGNTWKGAD